jgi:AraC-like DNA-binding protein/quercetin dioxygenase-like cupin family protein
MKAQLEDIPSKQGGASFYQTKISVPAFEFKWHYHPEYELTYILKGNGYRVVGNSHEQFSEGDLVLLGSNLPHTWCGKLDDGAPSKALVIQFSKDFIEPFLKLNESQSIQNLLELSHRGICCDTNQLLVDQIYTLTNTSGLDSVLSLLSILDQLSKGISRPLTTENYHGIITKQFESRVNKVCTHLQQHFHEAITLKQVADLVFMSESNFCKFFKKATNTTFSDYLNDLRINEACHLLLSSEENISKIAHDCGFESLSYFNRVFLKKKQLTPSGFRRGKLLN